jgi:hypothetical protein
VKVAVLFLTIFGLSALLHGALDVNSIVQKSVVANNRDWEAAPQFNFSETDQVDGGTKTFEISMILGSPYQRLTAINGKPLSEAAAQKERDKENQALAERSRESSRERARRIAKYDAERKRDRVMLQQLTRALEFKLCGEEKINGRDTYVLDATPLPGYKPPNMEAQVITGMEGRLWIDKQTYQWVKVEAKVVRPVNIGGFLARVIPGTRFELENEPVAPGVWLPSHLQVNSFAKILMMVGHNSHQDETYSAYVRNHAPNTNAGQ